MCVKPFAGQKRKWGSSPVPASQLLCAELLAWSQRQPECCLHHESAVWEEGSGHRKQRPHSIGAWPVFLTPLALGVLGWEGGSAPHSLTGPTAGFRAHGCPSGSVRPGAYGEATRPGWSRAPHLLTPELTLSCAREPRALGGEMVWGGGDLPTVPIWELAGKLPTCCVLVLGAVMCRILLSPLRLLRTAREDKCVHAHLSSVFMCVLEQKYAIVCVPVYKSHSVFTCAQKTVHICVCQSGSVHSRVHK
jgi:hypothetical protein